MVGERSIQGAARRGLERQRQKREQHSASDNEVSDDHQDHGAEFETAIAAQSSSAKKMVKSGTSEDQAFCKPFHTSSPFTDEGPVKQVCEGSMENRWKRL